MSHLVEKRLMGHQNVMMEKPLSPVAASPARGNEAEMLTEGALRLKSVAV